MNKSNLRVLFMGTPDFAVPSLKALIENFDVIGVVTQTDKPRGRGNTVQPTPIKTVAIENEIPVYQPTTFKDFAFESELKELNPDVIAVVAYGKLIDKIAALNPESGEAVDEAALGELKARFKKGMDADLNTSLGITALYDVLKAKTNDATKLAALADFDKVLCLNLLDNAAKVREEAKKAEAAEERDPVIDGLVADRTAAKKAKNFQEADRIRDELKAMGIEIIDTPQGTKWKRI